MDRGKVAQDLRQIGAAELTGSTGAVGKGRQTDPGPCIARGRRHISFASFQGFYLTELVTLMTAAVLGFLHALEIDHMLAVTAFVSRRPSLGTAAQFGFRWGMGHSLAVLAVGGLLLLTGLRWPERWDRGGEAAVGVMLVLIGAWSLRATRNLHLHPPAEHGDHVHLHAHGKPGQATDRRTDGPTHDHPGPHHHHHRHSRGITLVGMVHGLAGTSAVVALVPVTLVDRVTVGAGYLVAFGLGTTAAMTIFALVTAAAMRHAAGRSLALGKQVSTVVGAGGVLVGLWWIGRAIWPGSGL